MLRSIFGSVGAASGLHRNFPMTCGPALRALVVGMFSYEAPAVRRALSELCISCGQPGPKAPYESFNLPYAISMITRPPLTIMPPPNNIRSSGTCPKSAHEMICETRKNSAI